MSAQSWSTMLRHSGPERRNARGHRTVFDLERLTRSETEFRRLLYTDAHMQITTMAIPAGGSIPTETHDNVTQFLRIEEGRAILFTMADDGVVTTSVLSDGWSAVIPAGVAHEVCNASDRHVLRLYSVYTPPVHAHPAV